MDILIKNVQEKHLPLLNELAKLLELEIRDFAERSDYDPEFVLKIMQGDEDIEAGRTTRITLDDIFRKESISKGLEDAKTGKLKPHADAKKLYEKWL